MIEITYDDDSVEISGHTRVDICAAVSSIVYTTINALLNDDENNIILEDDETYMRIKLKNSEYLPKLLFNNMICMFEQLAEQEKGYIKIKKASE